MKTLPSTHKDRRSEILDAACRVIIRDGIDGIRSASVAREAGVSTALPHYYFPTLEDLSHAAFLHVDRPTPQGEATTDPLDQLLSELERDFRGTKRQIDERWMLRTEFQRAAIFDDEMRTLVQASEQRRMRALTDAIRAAQEAGEVAERIDAAMLGVRLASLALGLGVFRLIGIVSTHDVLERLGAAVDARNTWATAYANPRAAPVNRELPPRHGDDRRAEILDATIRVIGRAGVGGVHFPEVATEASVSMSLPRYYFPTIRDLIRAAFAHDEDVARQRVLWRAAAISDPLDRLRDAYANEILGYPDEMRLSWVLWAEYLRLGSREHGARSRARARLEDWIDYDRSTIREAQLSGHVPTSVDADLAALDLSAVLNGAGALWTLGLLTPEQLAAVTDGAIGDSLG